MQLRSRCAAHQYLQDIAAVKVAAGHSYALLGDLNARVGSAAAAGQRIGQYGEPGQPNLAGKELISLLSASDACLLNSRTPGDNITFNLGDRPCSILDYAMVPAELYHEGAAAAAGGPAWQIQHSGHIPVVATIPVRAVRTRVPVAPPVYKWRLDAFLNNEGKAELCALYEEALEAEWQRVSDAAQHQPPETLVRTVTRVIAAAAEAAVEGLVDSRDQRRDRQAARVLCAGACQPRRRGRLPAPAGAQAAGEAAGARCQGRLPPEASVHGELCVQ